MYNDISVTYYMDETLTEHNVIARKVFDSILHVSDNSNIVCCLLIDSLYQLSNESFVESFLSILHKKINNDLLTTNKLVGIMKALREWNVRHQLSSNSNDILLEIIKQQVVGGEKEDSCWISHVFYLLSLSFSYVRFHELVTLATQKRKFIPECTESYIFALKSNLNFVLDQNVGSDKLYLNTKIMFDRALERNKLNNDLLTRILEDVMTLPKASKSKKAILYIHGLGSSPDDTWSRLNALLEHDLKPLYSMKFAKYKSVKPGILNLLFGNKNKTSIQSLAECIKTTIDESLMEYDDITLVCHSLGGVIGKKYLINELQYSKENLKISKAIFFATPHHGSHLSNLAKYVSPTDTIYHQLSIGSSFLNELNKDWSLLKGEDYISCRYIIGQCDDVVPEFSASGASDPNNVRIIPEVDHRTIVSPDSPDDLSYKTAINFIATK